MSLIGSFSGLLYNKFVQSPKIQKMGFGVGVSSLGWQVFSSTLQSTPGQAQISARKSVAQKVIGLGLMGLGGALFLSGGQSLYESSAQELRSLFSQPEKMDSRPKGIYESFFENQDNKKSGLNKVLCLAGSEEEDYNLALSPQNPYSLAKSLSRISDLVYKTIRHPHEICEAISSNSKTGSIQDLIISAHGNTEEIGLTNTTCFSIFERLPDHCFDGLAPDARIFIESCCTGQPNSWKPNVGEWLSFLSGREVIAPSGILVSNYGESSLKGGRINIVFRCPFVLNVGDGMFQETFANCNQNINVANSWKELALFSAKKMVVPTLLATLTIWQSMRIANFILGMGGAGFEWIVDRSASPIRSLAERTKLYNPKVAQAVYEIGKTSAQMLKIANRILDSSMNKVTEHITNIGKWCFNKSFQIASAKFQRLFS